MTGAARQQPVVTDGAGAPRGVTAWEAFTIRWRYFWAKRSGPGGARRLAARLASIGTPPYHGRSFLAESAPRGFVAPSARVDGTQLRLGPRAYVGDGVTIFHGVDGGPVELQDRVQVYGDTMFHTGLGGRISLGPDTHVQPRCHFSAYIGAIAIGARVEIAPACAFYAYNHGTKAGTDIMLQPLESKGGIRIGDGAWLGHGVVVLDGVEIGEGAVVAAASTVVRSIPANAIAAGSPARVIRQRQ